MKIPYEKRWGKDGRARAAPRAPTVPERPIAGSQLEFTLTDDFGSRYVVYSRSTGTYLRMGSREVAFLRGLDGRRSTPGLVQSPPEGFSSEHVGALLMRFAQLGLLEGSTAAPAERNRRVRIGNGFSTIQISLLDPDALLDRALPLVKLAVGPVGRLLSMLLLVIGAIGLISNFGEIVGAADGPYGPGMPIMVLAGVLLVTMIHEIAHAATVKYYGGRVHRLGVMLFYLMPALFCDTSDAYRFRSRWQRVAVSLAGVWCQLVFSALAVIALVEVGEAGGERLHTWLALFAMANLFASALNLVPFVKLDGYWMLSSATDTPNLRSRSISYVFAWVRWALTGTGRPTRRPARPLLLASFGLASALFAPLLVLIALLEYQDVLLRFGWTGAVTWTMLASFVLLSPFARLPKLASWVALQKRYVLLRFFVSTSVLGILATVGLGQIQLPVALDGSYSIGGSEARKPYAVAYVDPAEAPLVEAGDVVLMRSESLLTPRITNSAVVTSDLPGHAQASALPTAAFDVPSAAVREQASFRVDLRRAPSANARPSFGPAVFLTTPRPIPDWFYTSYLRPVLIEII